VIRLDLIKVKLLGQGHKPAFKVTGGKLPFLTKSESEIIKTRYAAARAGWTMRLKSRLELKTVNK